nr:hypothetical protein [Egibacter rhizosphaerae]
MGVVLVAGGDARRGGLAFGHPPAQGLDHRESLGARMAGQHDHELVTPVAGEGRLLGNELAPASRQLGQQHVAGPVVVDLVERLEVVDVQHAHRRDADGHVRDGLPRRRSHGRG